MMKSYDNYNIQNLTESRLFANISREDIHRLLSCLQARWMTYHEETIVVREGDCIRDFGILLSENGCSFRTDGDGRTVTITLLQKGSEIGVILAASPGHKSPVSVEVQKGASILFISYPNMMNNCTRNCTCHKQLLQNFIGIVAEKGLVLHERINCLLKPSVREKIMTYLTRMAQESGQQIFTIPLDRNSMAEYLNIERTALSRELSRMKKDGILDFHKSTFHLFDKK